MDLTALLTLLANQKKSVAEQNPYYLAGATLMAGMPNASDLGGMKDWEKALAMGLMGAAGGGLWSYGKNQAEEQYQSDLTDILSATDPFAAMRDSDSFSELGLIAALQDREQKKKTENLLNTTMMQELIKGKVNQALGQQEMDLEIQRALGGGGTATQGVAQEGATGQENPFGAPIVSGAERLAQNYRDMVSTTRNPKLSEKISGDQYMQMATTDSKTMEELRQRRDQSQRIKQLAARAASIIPKAGETGGALESWQTALMGLPIVGDDEKLTARNELKAIGSAGFTEFRPPGIGQASDKEMENFIRQGFTETNTPEQNMWLVKYHTANADIIEAYTDFAERYYNKAQRLGGVNEAWRQMMGGGHTLAQRGAGGERQVAPLVKYISDPETGMQERRIRTVRGWERFDDAVSALLGR